MFFFGCSEVNTCSSWLITSELANQHVQKVLFTCVVYTKFQYIFKHLMIKSKPPISGIESFSFLETPEDKQMALKARTSTNDECGATASIGASAELLSSPFTLIQ